MYRGNGQSKYCSLGAQLNILILLDDLLDPRLCDIISCDEQAFWARLQGH